MPDHASRVTVSMTRFLSLAGAATVITNSFMVGVILIVLRSNRIRRRSRCAPPLPSPIATG